MKYKLDNSFVHTDFFEETRLFGIVSSFKNYRFCWELNGLFGYNFKLNPEIEIELLRKGRKYYFPVYESRNIENTIAHYLYYNLNDGEYLLPEFKHINFLWLMKGEITFEEKITNLIHLLGKIKGIQLVTELKQELIVDKNNMLF